MRSYLLFGEELDDVVEQDAVEQEAVTGTVTLVLRIFGGFVQSNILGTAPRFKSRRPESFLVISSVLKCSEQTTVFAAICNRYTDIKKFHLCPYI